MTQINPIKVAAAIPLVKVGNCRENLKSCASLLEEAADQGVQIVVFPELNLTAYTCADLFQSSLLLHEAEEALVGVAELTALYSITAIVGLPIRVNNGLYNCGVVVNKGQILGAIPKTFLPNYNEFYEKRWFTSGLMAKTQTISFAHQNFTFGPSLLFKFEETLFSLEICEDLWTPIPPSSHLCLKGAQIIFNLSASNDTIGKKAYRDNLIANQSGRCISAYVYASAGFGESSTDLVYSGQGIIAENGTILKQSKAYSTEPQLIIEDIDVERLIRDRQKNGAFSTLSSSEEDVILACDLNQDKLPSPHRTINPWPFVPQDKENLDKRCQEILEMQAHGLAVRLYHTGIKKAVVGISGGLDSTLALLVTVNAFKRLNLDVKNIVGLTLPGFGTTNRTYTNALLLMERLGITYKEISIKAACLQHFKDIETDPTLLDITYENTQARERTQILFDYANKIGGLLIGTGDLSEMALGWATYNGDHMSSYAVNSSIPKTLVSHLVHWMAHYSVDEQTKACLLDICQTPISPELLPANEDDTIKQKTEDVVGPYELHDFFLYYTLRFGFSPSKIRFLACRAFKGTFTYETINHWIKVFFRRFFMQQFKRTCIPDGPKVGSVNLSPRGDWRMPTDGDSSVWLKDLD